MNETPRPTDTVGSKLRQMEKDLESIVVRLNRTRQYKDAMHVLAALIQVAQVLELNVNLPDEVLGGDGEYQFDDWPWDWQP